MLFSSEWCCHFSQVRYLFHQNSSIFVIFLAHSSANPHITGCRYLLNNIWSKKGDEYLWKMINGVHLTKFPITEIYFKLHCSRYSETKQIFPWCLVMAWSCKRDWMWKIIEISCTGNWFEKNIEFWVQFAAVSERLLVSFFSTIWRNKKQFLRVDTVSKCFVHIWKRVNKKSEASEALSSWCFFRLNEVANFLKFAIYFIKILPSL